jgi:PAS domain S-box-containing protein
VNVATAFSNPPVPSNNDHAAFFAELSPDALDLLFLIDWNGRIISAADRAMPGKHLVELFDPIDQETLQQVLTRRWGRAVARRGERRHEVAVVPFGERGGRSLAIVRDITGQRAAPPNPQDVAENTSERLAAIVATSDDAIISKDLNGIIHTWNDGAERIFGYTAAEVIGKPITVLMTPAQALEEPLILAKIGRGEKIDHHRTTRRRKDGSMVEISLTISAIRDPSGRIIGASKIARDVTREQESERKLQFLLEKEKEARSEAEALIESARALAENLDLEKTVQKATDIATQVSGAKFGAFFYNVVNDREESYTLYTISGVPREAFSKFPMPRNTAVFAPTFKGEGIVRLADVRADPRYGRNAPHHGMPEGHLPVRSYLAVPVIGRNGDVIGGMFFGHPDAEVFTERAERIVAGIAAQAAIAIDNAKLYSKTQSSLARLNFSLGALQLGDWTWDAATDEMRISPRTAEIYGIPVQGGTREALRAVLHPEDRERAREAAKRAVETATDYEIEYRVRHPVHGERWVLAKGRPQLDGANKVAGMLGVVQDITDRKRVELELRESQAKLASHAQVLEQHVAERTARLRETIGELEAFSYTVSHDMRTPLRSMHGYADRLLKVYRSQLNEEAIHHLERISKNAERLELLVRDVLAYSKVAKSDIQLAPVELGRFLAMLLPAIPETQRSGVKVNVHEPLPVVLAHEAYLSQIFTNLIGNAVKFSAAGRPALIDIRAETRDGQAVISVCDNGIGIAPENFERIFEIFGRVYPDKQYDGTGIGLAIVKKAVQRMQGQISVQSTLGEGSCFSFTLSRP